LPKIKKTPIIEKIKFSYPIEYLYKQFAKNPNTAFLQSSLKSDSGRYSFIGIEPFITLTSKNFRTNLNIKNHKITLKLPAFDCLESILDLYQLSCPKNLPFAGGGIGYFSYDLKNSIEKLQKKAKNDLNLPEMYFVFYQALITQDNLTPGELYISVLDPTSPELKSAVTVMNAIKNTISSCLKKPLFCEKNVKPAEKFTLKSNFSKKNYIRILEKAINYIYAGDIYQVCLAQRFQTKSLLTPFALYQKLNKINPSPFSAFLNFNPCKIISSSPELFLKINQGMIETRPMKGTRPRGKNKNEDKFYKTDLQMNDKETAELSMIVDLLRNDLGKISVPGSVKVTEHRRIETYPTVFQTISIIRGKIAKEISLIDAIKAAFPGGSISGCPKIRAMEIIEELEPIERGVYTGAIGYISFHDTMALNIAIRTMIMQNKNVYFHAGGGITADSDPEKEYEETLIKTHALVKSLQ
ncbi:MAG: aminodeoxychorismate synthase component I, partial [Candidatus Omnitrophica bacterium]|nr:aminodeoxychorismate synthase component I [Candidatus Omnitrophota bacterium]MBU1894448.1 aminodeoxychorismate synthase component I [Candidatus Omnitrophota bacterium]